MPGVFAIPCPCGGGKKGKKVGALTLEDALGVWLSGVAGRGPDSPKHKPEATAENSLKLEAACTQHRGLNSEDCPGFYCLGTRSGFRRLTT